ncbi:unnamed protein product [Paramecium primaurelia]|uniref:WD40-repeat-containing domain n=1 Tax=Paramecium primaurelia TaxID=5886 RepID=A0A8S1QR96_PARPR|nr:unnamed protein product [Paramecium primaurelia]
MQQIYQNPRVQIGNNENNIINQQIFQYYSNFQPYEENKLINIKKFQQQIDLKQLTDCSQKVKGRSKGISFRIFNQNEDLFVSGSFDRSIKFSVEQNKRPFQQTINLYKWHFNHFLHMNSNLKMLYIQPTSDIEVFSYFSKTFQINSLTYHLFLQFNIFIYN